MADTQTGPSAELAALAEKLKKGEMTAFEHAAKRKALMQRVGWTGHRLVETASAAAGAAPVALPAAGAAASAPAAPSAAAPAASAASVAPETPKADEPPKPKLPSAWGETPASRDRGPKAWSPGGRTDDPTKRVIHAPTASGIGTGKSFLFLFGFKIHSERDQAFLIKETEQINDDVELLRQHGYTVVVDPQATRQDFLDAVAGKGAGAEGLVPAGFYWSAHGNDDGSLETCDGGLLRPDHIDAQAVSPGLRLAIFASCYVGCRSRTWRKALGGHPLVVGWGRPVTIDRAVEFLQQREGTETDFDDLVRRYLLTERPIPAEGGAEFAPTTEAAATGRAGDVPERIRKIVDQLGAMWRNADRCVEVNVPLEGGRHQVSKVFIVDSSAPYSEGEPLLGVESDVGELTTLVDPTMLLGGQLSAGYSRVALVASKTEMPRIVVQGFMPLAQVRDQDLATLIFQVCEYADTLEQRIFGGDFG
jgi:hypothetical protein